MKPLLRVQMDCCVTDPGAGTDQLRRQKAIELLRALLMEAAINQDAVPASAGERESGNE